MTSIDLLEQRVTELEHRIYGLNKNPSIDDPLPENSIIDSILHANTLIASALSGREKTNNLVKRLPELNDMLDPSYDSTDLHAEAKLELLLATESEIRECHKNVQRLEELSPALKLDSIKDVPELLPKLNQLTFSYIKCQEEREEVTRNVGSLFTEYNNLIDSIVRTLVILNEKITRAEVAALPRKVED